MGFYRETPRTMRPEHFKVARVRVENGGTNLGAITTAAIQPLSPSTTLAPPPNTGQLAPTPQIVVPTTTPTSGPPPAPPTLPPQARAYAKGYGVIMGSDGVEYTHVNNPRGWSTWKPGLGEYLGGTSFIAENAAPADVLAIWAQQNATAVAPTTTPTTQPTDQPPPTTPSDTPSATDVAAAAAPFVAPISPAAAAAGAILPAVAAAANAEPSTQVRFDDSDAEIYNADGTPVTSAAKTATFVDKLKALPPAAKLGGIVLLAILLTKGKR